MSKNKESQVKKCEYYTWEEPGFTVELRAFVGGRSECHSDALPRKRFCWLHRNEGKKK
jgi:hypothetical protein